MPPSWGMPLSSRTGTEPLLVTSRPPTRATTSSATISWAQAADCSGSKLVMQVCSSRGRPPTPPSSVLTNSTPPSTARRTSGKDPSGVSSWLIIPMTIGSAPASAATGASGIVPMNHSSPAKRSTTVSPSGTSAPEAVVVSVASAATSSSGAGSLQAPTRSSPASTPMPNLFRMVPPDPT